MCGHVGGCWLGAFTNSAAMNSPGCVFGAHTHNISIGSEIGRSEDVLSLADTAPRFSKVVTLVDTLSRSV